jgi:DNA-directed RNA polymerase subunit delta
MKRIIKKFDSVEQRHLDLIETAFPGGFGEEHLVSVPTHDGRWLRCLEVRTEDTVYLFRIDAEMLEVLEEGLDIDVDVQVEEDLDAEED